MHCNYAFSISLAQAHGHASLRTILLELAPGDGLNFLTSGGFHEDTPRSGWAFIGRMFDMVGWMTDHIIDV